MKLINKHILITVSVFVSLGAFIFGYSIVSISMTADLIARHNNLTDQQRSYQLSIITTLLPIGAFLGTFLTQPLSQKIGERKTMIYMDIFAFLTITYQSYSMDLVTLYLTRFGIGIYLGISGTVIPAYLVSISPPELTGIIGTFNQLLITIGVSVGYRLGMNPQMGWDRYIFFPAYFCILRILSLLSFKFDSLERHYKHHERQEIKKYIDMFYEKGTIDEFSKLRGFSEEGNQGDKVSQKKEYGGGFTGLIAKLTGGASKKIIVMALFIPASNQLCGINAIIYYSKQIFQHIVTPEEALYDTYYLGLLQVVFTFISAFLINSYGRRTLMLLGSGIIAFSLIFGWVASLMPNGEYMLILLIFLHIIGFSISIGPVGYIYAAQIMEDISLVVIVNWILTIMVSSFSEIMIKAIGIGQVFLFFGVSTLLCMAYFYKYMVESKGKNRKVLIEQFEQEVVLYKRKEEEATSILTNEPSSPVTSRQELKSQL